MRFKQFITESPDEVSIPDKELSLHWSDEDTVSFFIGNNIQIWSDSPRITHGTLLYVMSYPENLNRIKARENIFTGQDQNGNSFFIKATGDLLSYYSFFKERHSLRGELIKEGDKKGDIIFCGRMWKKRNFISFWNNIDSLSPSSLNVLQKKISDLYNIDVEKLWFEFPGGDGGEYENEFTWDQLKIEVSANKGVTQTEPKISDKLHIIDPAKKGQMMKGVGMKPKAPLGAAQRFAMGESFKTYFEASQEYIDKIQDAVDKVSDRPFNELFEGKGDRFLIKVFNPSFEKAARNFGISEDIDLKSRTIKGKHINIALRELKDKISKEFTIEKLHKLRDELKKVFLNDEDVKLIIDNTMGNLTKQNIHFQRNNNVWQSEPMGHRKGYDILTMRDNMVASFTDEELKNLDININPHHFLNEEEVSKLIQFLIDENLFEVIDDASYQRYKNHRFSGAVTFLAQEYNRIINKPLTMYKKRYDQHVKGFSKLKQAIDQNNIYYYLLFSRHPIDVLRMSDHKGISSCHRLGGGKYSSSSGDYAHCALADAKNDGGIVYLIKGNDGKKVKDNLTSREVFYDKDRATGLIKPIGRIRLRRFIDVKTGKDFAIPTTLQSEQKYGFFTEEVYSILLNYLRKNQSVYNNPPDADYAAKNIVMVGGNYSDENLDDLFNTFFGENISTETPKNYKNIKHKSGSLIGWQEEINEVLQRAERLKPEIEIHAQSIQRNGYNRVHVRVFTKLNVPLTGLPLDNVDLILGNELDHNKTMSHHLKVFNLQMVDITERSEWTNGILNTEVSFNLSDPQWLSSLYESCFILKERWGELSTAITTRIKNYIVAMEEDK